jgi:hypothetical protein
MSHQIYTSNITPIGLGLINKHRSHQMYWSVSNTSPILRINSFFKEEFCDKDHVTHIGGEYYI